MAQLINVEKKNMKNESFAVANKGKTPPLFRTANYILMVAAAVLLVAGYILLSGGKAASDAEFSEAIFNTRRMVVAPVLMFAGLLTGLLAIMYHPRTGKQKTSKEA
ncbi:MAG: DUF3098 domain-containing protein [Bacteroidales bacterium]|jgi:hypothetical protein|nr:DUF3098 domain-containing protein [Bacteroidales bacterium]